jgi:hypothetical protein
MIFLILLALLIPVMIGFLSISLIWRDRPANQTLLIVKSCLAVGLGFGISSCISFVCLLSFGELAKGPIIETALLIVLIPTLVYTFKGRKDSPDLASYGHNATVVPSKTQWFLAIGFWAALVSALVAAIFLALKSPHGIGWDAWTIWNLRARFLFRGGAHWTDAAAIFWVKPDYPLLIPATIAQAWTYLGNDTVIIPVLVAMLFTFATVGLIVSSLFIFRSKSQGYLGGLILLGTPFFIKHGMSQYADVPLGFFFLATMVLFTLHERARKATPGLLTLTGMAAGFSAWIKNEGLLFLVAAIASHGAVIVAFKGWKTYLRQMLSFALGLLPVLIIIAYFKITLAPSNDLLSGQDFQGTLGRLTDLSRYWVIFKAFVRGSFYFGEWYHLIGIPPLLGVYLLGVGVKTNAEDRLPTLYALLVLSLTLTGYFLVYVATPHDLLWHLRYSLERLLLQLWPSFIFTYLLIVGRPDPVSLATEHA